MSDLVEVAFKGNRKEFFRWEDVVPPPSPPAHVIVEGDRGEDLGQVHTVGAAAEQRFAGVAHGAMLGAARRLVVRIATRDEVRRAQTLAVENETTRRAAMAQARVLGLQMKVTDADWQWDRRKLTLYFTAEKRVDFRTLVRDLAATFKARIELKQIGVRDEAKRLDGVGRCGRQYCSASWLPDLRPVNLGVAKEQKLSLNPTQISGACGRLMCCLRYEHEFYVQSRKRFPKEGKIIATAKGEEKVMLNDIFHDRVTLRAPDGETRIITLLELRRETSAWTPGGTEEFAVADARDAAEEGIVAFDDTPTLRERTRLPATNRALPVLPVSALPAVPAAAPVATAGVTPAGRPPALPPVGSPVASAVGTPVAVPFALPPLASPVASPVASAVGTPVAVPFALPPLESPVGSPVASREVQPPLAPAAGAPQLPSDDDEDAGGEDADGEDADGEDESGDAAMTDADGSTGEGPRRRRRRGRRGGRRGRGNRPAPGGDEPPAAP